VSASTRPVRDTNSRWGDGLGREKERDEGSECEIGGGARPSCRRLTVIVNGDA
jgi:hypothetical protein